MSLEKLFISPLRICHVTSLFRPYFAGHAIYLERVFKYLSEKGVENFVLTGNYDDLKKDEIIDRVHVHRIKMKKEWKKGNLMFTIQAIPYLLRVRKKFNVVHLHGFWDVYGLFTLFAKIFKKKIILHMVLFRGDDPMTIQKGYKFMKWRFRLLSSIDAFISISSPISTSYKQTCLPSEKLFHIPQGVDTDVFSPVSKEEKIRLRKELGLSEYENIVTFVGAIIQRKGVDILMDAWSEVNKKINNSLLLLIGPDTFEGFDGINVSALDDFVHKMKDKAKESFNIKFLGKSNKIALYLQASDIFVLPSRHEGFGNVVIEAMACGVPVVIKEMDGVANDLIIDGEEGYIIKDKDELVDKLTYLLKNQEVCIEAGKKARERALNKFDLDKICNKYVEIYKSTT